MTQISIDYSGTLPVSAQTGMAEADANANEQWKRVVDGAIQSVARKLEEFTTDDVWEELAKLPNPPTTHRRCAIGPRMARVSKELKYMVATDRVKRSRGDGMNGNLLRVWRSRLI